MEKTRKAYLKIELDGQLLKYKQNTTFLGVYVTTKLNWRLHIENLINKARKRLNFLYIKIFKKQDTVLESGHKNVITFINIFSETETDLWSGGIFSRTKHTPKEAAKHR